MRKISLYALSSVLFTPTAFAVQCANTNVIYYDVSGECENRWCCINPGYGCCPNDQVATTLPAPEQNGFFFAGYSTTPSTEAEHVAELAAIGMGGAAHFINTYDDGTVPNILYAQYVPSCQINNALDGENIYGYNTNAYCEPVLTESGQIVVNAEGKPQYNTSCYAGFVYASGEGTYHPRCRKPNYKDETSDYPVNTSGCSATHPELCDRTACTKTVLNANEYNKPWMWEMGYNWCIDENTGAGSCQRFASLGCCIGTWDRCTTRAGCLALNDGDEHHFIWDNVRKVCANSAYENTFDGYSVFYKCADNAPTIMNTWGEVNPTDMTHTAYTLQRLIDNSPDSESGLCKERTRLGVGHLWEFLGWKIEGTNTIVQPSEVFQYTQYASLNDGSITLVGQWQSHECSENDFTYCDREECEALGSEYMYCVDKMAITDKYPSGNSSPVNVVGCVKATVAPDGQCCSRDPRYCTWRQCTGYAKDINDSWDVYWALDTVSHANNQYCAMKPDLLTNVAPSAIYMLDSYGSGAGPKFLDYWDSDTIMFKKKSDENIGYITRWSGWFDMDPNTNLFTQYYATTMSIFNKLRVSKLAGHLNLGEYDQPNCAGNKIINADGTFSTNAPLNVTHIDGRVDEVLLYPCFQEINTEEPADGLLKVYISGNVANQYFGDFVEFADGTTIPSDDSKLHREDPENVWYGPVYFRGSLTNGENAEFYADRNGTTPLPHGLPKFTGDGFLTASPHFLTRGYSTYDDSYAFQHEHEWNPMITFGPNNNRSVLYGTFNPLSNNNQYKLAYDCNGGDRVGNYLKVSTSSSPAAECTTNPATTKLPTLRDYGTYSMLPDEAAHPSKVCECIRPGYHITGWKISGTDTVIAPWTPYRWVWRENKTAIAQWEPD